MDKFILLFRGSEVYEDTQSPEALELLTVKMMDWVHGLIQNGQHVSSEKFHRAGQQLKGDPPTATDNATIHLKDIIGGCTIVQASNYNEALTIARACPILATNATIEIRQLQSV